LSARATIDNNDNGFKETKLREFIEMLKIKRLVLNKKKEKIKRKRV